jgi:hypothetical protein
MAHYIPCQGRLIALSFTLESSIKGLKSESPRAFFTCSPAFEVPAATYGQAPE